MNTAKQSIYFYRQWFDFFCSRYMS